jgi:hypothetical protein
MLTGHTMDLIVHCSVYSVVVTSLLEALLKSEIESTVFLFVFEKQNLVGTKIPGILMCIVQ